MEREPTIDSKKQWMGEQMVLARVISARNALASKTHTEKAYLAGTKTDPLLYQILPQGIVHNGTSINGTKYAQMTMIHTIKNQKSGFLSQPDLQSLYEAILLVFVLHPHRALPIGHKRIVNSDIILTQDIASACLLVRACFAILQSPVLKEHPS